ncbi:MAG: PepSY-associated TM helix domain-containing protein [Bacteroidota bacterium]
MSVKKLIGKVHLWLGLASGLVVFIVSITGCIYVFKKELRSLFHNSYVHINTKEGSYGNFIPASELLDIAKAEMGKGFKVTLLETGNHDKAASVRFYKDSEHAKGRQFVWYGDKSDYFYTVYIHPFSGQVLKVENTKWEFFNLVVQVHTNLLIGPIGQTIVSFSVLVFVIMLLTGIILWWPHNKKSFRTRTWFRWKPNAKWARKNYDLHNILGFYMLFFALIISITGLSWSFGWVRESIVWVGNGGTDEKTVWPLAKSNSIDGKSEQGINRAQAKLVNTYPNADEILIFMPRDSVASLIGIVRLKEDVIHSWHYFDQYSGKSLDTLLLDDMPSGERLNMLGYPIHIGSILSLPGKILAFFVSLISASLPVTGFLIWWRRRRKREQRSKGRKYPEPTIFPKLQK